MQLHVNHSPDPGEAARFAADIIEMAADISGAELDYSPASIGVIEDIVDGFRAEGATSGEMADSLVAFGCYVGEVVIRHVGGSWQHTTDALRVVPLAVRLPGQRDCHPVDWVFRRLELGSRGSIRELYEAALASVAAEADG
ncbi:hypothetical protein G3I76_25890 [Streptomyces sp. SID11233]|uniref:hypothetical protein n=1 Tax=Streptomyces sp. SID11385 TaxID=2706031 RepID=UPI0013BF4B25|nr:hypothetical protein [Streptomyces sp. SID11385]NEA39857.1 hypothetical protein [Streptomyces sp. SID11385]NED83511.1 hypothetical protein [Streptomyces sp. SID11233]